MLGDCFSLFPSICLLIYPYCISNYMLWTSNNIFGMLSFRSEIPWQEPITNMHRFHNSIIGTTPKGEILQIDTRNQIIDKTLSFMNEDYSFPNINESKYLYTDYGNTYFFSFDKKIVSAEGQIVEQSNSKADFVRGLDGRDDLFIFCKHHRSHDKHSLNVKKIGNQKKIIKLMDYRANKIGLIGGGAGKCIFVESSDENVSILYGQNWNEEDDCRANRFQVDHNYVYMLSSSEKRSSPQKRSQYNTSEIYRQSSKIRVEAYDKDKIGKGKGYSQFEFSLGRYPVKIDSFQTDIIIAFDNSLQIYDVRKITKPFQKENESGIKDFLYEPNLQRIYLSSRKGLSVYDYK